jgi:hypothetical protein
MPSRSIKTPPTDFANVGADSMTAAERMNPALHKGRRESIPPVALCGMLVLVGLCLLSLLSAVHDLRVLFLD